MKKHKKYLVLAFLSLGIPLSVAHAESCPAPPKHGPQFTGNIYNQTGQTLTINAQSSSGDWCTAAGNTLPPNSYPINYTLTAENKSINTTVNVLDSSSQLVCSFIFQYNNQYNINVENGSGTCAMRINYNCSSCVDLFINSISTTKNSS